MSETKHTPGPWRIGTPGPNGCYTVGTERGLMTAMVAHSINMADQKQQAIADARLIAAAPDLLAALKNLLGDIQDEDKDRSPHDWSVQVCVRNALVAIKKATGE